MMCGCHNFTTTIARIWVAPWRRLVEDGEGKIA
jgi:hypothetical protein